MSLRPPEDRPIELSGAEALRLLGSVSLGRVVFTRHALPTVRPVNHALDGGDIVLRTHEGAALASHTGRADDQGVVVAYEADTFAPRTHLGWRVVVTGYARLVTDPEDLVRCQRWCSRGWSRPWTRRFVSGPTWSRASCFTADGRSGGA